MDRCIDCPALTLRAYKFRDEMVSGFLCRTGVPVVCTARLSENNCNQFFNFCQLCPEDVSVSDGREFNGEDDFSASVYRGNAKAYVPQKLIISISVTLRYFPAIREEAGYIRDAMCLRNIRGMERLEAMAVPLMISASETAEELSAAAVTRGIENPAPKTSIIRLHMGPFDWIYVALSIVFAAAAIIM